MLLSGSLRRDSHLGKIPVGNFSHNRKKLQIHQGLDKKRACSVIFKKVGVDYYYEAEAWQSPWKKASSFYTKHQKPDYYWVVIFFIRLNFTLLCPNSNCYQICLKEER